MRIVFLDTETTGLDADRCAIVQYALAVWNDGDVTATASRFVMPWVGAELQPRALQVNGYHPETWAAVGATPFGADDIRTMHDFLGGAVVGGSNVNFDKGFVAAACKRFGGQPPRWNHRNADTGSMAFPLHASGIVESTGLGALTKHYGIDYDGDAQHDAARDVAATIAVFEALCADLLFKPARWREALEEIRGKYAGGPGLGARTCAEIAAKALAGE